MDIDEMKQLKHAAEQQIRQIIAEFQIATRLSVSGLSVRIEDCSTVGGAHKSVVADVSLDVRL